MKIRADFVTNSSSSSFILSRKGELNEKQKEALLQLIEDKMLGKKFLTPENTEEEILKEFQDNWMDDDEQEEIREALGRGETVYSGWVSFDECDYNYADLYEKIWRVLEENADDNFRVLNGDLSY